MSEMKDKKSANGVPQPDGKRIVSNTPPAPGAAPSSGAPSSSGAPDAEQRRREAERQLLQNRGGRPGGPRGMGGPVVIEKPKNAKKTVGKLLRYIGRSKFLVIAMLLATIVSTLLSLTGPALQGRAIDSITLTEGRPHVDFDSLVRTLTLMLSVYVASALINFGQGLLTTYISQKTVYSMRADLFSKIARLSIRYTDTHKHGDIMSRITNDVDNVSNTISSSLSSLFSSAITLVGALAMIISYSWKMALVALVTIPLTIFVSSLLSKFMRKYFVERQVLLGQLNGQVEETVTGYKTVMAFSREAASRAEFAKTSDEFRKCSIKANIWGGIMGPAMNIINNLNYLIVAAFGGYFAIKGQITVGNIQSILQYSRQFSMPINTIANQYAQILTAIAGAERVFDILDSPSEPDEGRNELAPADIRGKISFSNIDFAYNPGEPVLRDLCLDVEPGKKVAIVGATGSGKTTIVNLLTRFYDVDSGSITLDGVDVTELPKSTLRRAIAIVLQDTVLFSDTIAANIRYGRLDATDEEVREAARTANADVFIERLPDGYNTVLTESGGNLSQGQRQLLSIARAVLADPKILILDEATSSVDTRTEMHIQQAMVALMKGRTSLIIAHRLSTIRDADMIVVISAGRVVETGSHDELLRAGGEYAKLYKTQYEGFST